MKCEKLFTEFLSDSVNLNKTRIEVAESGIETITKFLKANEFFAEKFINTIPQGSFRQQTIIKPVDDNDFDVDLMFELKPVEGWSAQEYHNKLAEEFKKTDRYKDKVDTRGKTRCVTIDYESDFHIDIVPAIQRPEGMVIMNRKTDLFERTDGDGYAKWFESRNSITGDKKLVHVVRLLKYIRDTQKKFEAKSIVLTTLLGNQVYDGDDKALYSDLPTTFKNVLLRLDSYLQANPNVPNVRNPILESEDFNRHWDQNKYEKFREAIHNYAILADDAYNDPNEEGSLGKWQKLFGDQFGVGQKSFATSQRINFVAKNREADEEFLSDLGIRENISHTLTINALVTQDGWRPFLLRAAMELLRKKRSLKFTIEHCDVLEPYSIKWKVKNLGQEAADRGQLRGEITDDNGFRNKDEYTLYEGSHYVECYIIKDGVCVAADRIDVPIGRF